MKMSVQRQAGTQADKTRARRDPGAVRVPRRVGPRLGHRQAQNVGGARAAAGGGRPRRRQWCVCVRVPRADTDGAGLACSVIIHVCGGTQARRSRRTLRVWPTVRRYWSLSS